MPANTLLAGTVMDAAAALMNDSAKVVYTYTIQVPYLNIALNELQEFYELHSMPSSQKSSTVIQVDAGETELTYGAVGTPALPDDMIEPEQLWERPRNDDPYIPMTRRSYLPHNLEGVAVSQFMYYVWQDGKIIVLPSNQNNDIKIDYVKFLFNPIVNDSSSIGIANAQTFLEYRTAGLMSEFIERNQASADKQNGYAALAIERATGIGIKSKQNIMTRRKPFRAAYKSRG